LVSIDPLSATGRKSGHIRSRIGLSALMSSGQFGRPARATLYKIQFNGAGGSQIYISFTHSAFQ
jgi:hypothetical protein